MSVKYLSHYLALNMKDLLIIIIITIIKLLFCSSKSPCLITVSEHE